jgi:trk system potassium uptake protein
MYVLVVGGGKVGLNLTRELMQKGHEVTLVESHRGRYAMLEPQLEHVVQLGDGTELWVLERAGIERADMVIAVTGDDEDNIIISQVAREKYGRESIIARCNNVRNMEHFNLLGIRPVVSSTDLILRLIEHEVPQYGLVHLLTLQVENLEIIEVEASPGSLAAGKRVDELNLSADCLAIAVLRSGQGTVPRADTVIEAGDEVLLVLNPMIEDDITRLFDAPEESFE